jgi:hypothetical protein
MPIGESFLTSLAKIQATVSASLTVGFPQRGSAIIYNGVGGVKRFLATRPRWRAGRGVKGGPTFWVGPFIEDP